MALCQQVQAGADGDLAGILNTICEGIFKYPSLVVILPEAEQAGADVADVAGPIASRETVGDHTHTLAAMEKRIDAAAISRCGP